MCLSCQRCVRHGGELTRQDAAEADLVADERLADMLKVDAALDALDVAGEVVRAFLA